MSCLSKSHRINTLNARTKSSLAKEFNKIYKSKQKWHTKSFVIFFEKNDYLKLAFVSSKKVGNAVYRNKARRKLRALALEKQNQLRYGSYIFVAKEELFKRDHKTLQKDFNFAMRKLGLFKE